jgi:putative SOS response-associated peptidase YedK
MCAHYEPVTERERYLAGFGVEPATDTGQADLWPGYAGSFIRRPRRQDHAGCPPPMEAMAGVFGLIPHWAKDRNVARHTYNARSETVAEKPSFRDAWRLGRRCIIPAEAFYEPDWRSGKAVPTRIARADKRPMGIAGLWMGWMAPDGSILRSYSMLTINADQHAVMKQFHKPQDEKRMVVILPEQRYHDWLLASPEQSRDFLRPWPADELTGTQAQAVEQHGAHHASGVGRLI